MRSFNLKLYILTPLALVGILLLGLFVFAVVAERHSDVDHLLQQKIQVVESYLTEAVGHSDQKLGALLAMFSRDEELQALLARGDREGLLKRTQPLFKSLRDNYNITHFYFHDINRVNVLRVHKPSRYGDHIERITAQKAEASGEAVYGLELGVLGTFTRRAVIPMVYQGRRIGYLELGEEIDQVVHDLNRHFGVEVVVIITKGLLSERAWQVGHKMMGRQGYWDDYSKYVVTSNTFADQVPDLREVLSSGLHSHQLLGYEEADHIYKGQAVPLTDVTGSQVGFLLVYQDMSPFYRETRAVFIVTIILGLVVGLLLVAFFYGVLSRAERQIIRSGRELMDLNTLLLTAQNMASFGCWDYRFSTKELVFPPASRKIVGIDNGYPIDGLDDLRALVYEDDRAAFSRFIDFKQDGEKVRDLVHRVVNPNGEIRVVSHHARFEFDRDGLPKRLIATVHDITDSELAHSLAGRMGHIFESSWNEFYIFHAETFEFIEASLGARHNLGYSMDELRGVKVWGIKPEFDLERFQALVAPLYSSETQLTFNTIHKRKDGSQYPVEVRLQLLADEKPPVFLAIVQDISERQQYIAQLERKALYDNLTELPNRNLLQDRLHHGLQEMVRYSSELSVLMIDIGRLQEINNVLGHACGDEVLREVARRLSASVRESDTVARVEGDELAVILPMSGTEQAMTVVKKIQKALLDPVDVENVQVQIEAAIGLASYPAHGNEVGLLLQRADTAMRIAKGELDGVYIYDAKVDPYSKERLLLKREIYHGVADNQFVLHYQPQVACLSNRVVGFEALARWPHPQRGVVSPCEFIPMIEQSGLIGRFTVWVIDEAAKQVQAWRTQGMDVTVSVNLSTRNLFDLDLPAKIEDIMDKRGISPASMVLEITETALMTRPERALRIVHELHDLGFHLAIDDFGTGYSSLSYLKELPVSELKIDQCFIRHLDENESDATIVRSTIDMAHELGLKVVAEGVETFEQFGLLASYGGDVAQGYFLSRPVGADDAFAWAQAFHQRNDVE